MSRWLAQRIINAVRAKVSIAKIAWDIVVLARDGQQPVLMGSSPDAESYIAALLPQLDDYRWDRTPLSW